MRGLMERIIRAGERRFGVDLDYLRDIARLSPAGFWKLALFLPLATHRAAVAAPLQAWAVLGATRAEDCGACVQIAIGHAKRAGIPPARITAALEQGESALPELEGLCLRFGRMVATNDPGLETVRQTLVGRLGEAAVLDLAVGAACARLWPGLKRGIGRAVSCQPVQVAA